MITLRDALFEAPRLQRRRLLAAEVWVVGLRYAGAMLYAAVFVVSFVTAMGWFLAPAPAPVWYCSPTPSGIHCGSPGGIKDVVVQI
jgi:hypothetical protein